MRFLTQSYLAMSLAFQSAMLPTAVIATGVVLTACSSASSQQKISKGSLVIALGDSLTYGYSADKSTAYPTVLGKLTGWNVKNEGINGNTSQDVLDRLDGIIAQKPKLVLLGIGGNDVLRRVNPSVTKDNISQIIKRLQDADIAVVLIAQPHLSASAVFGKASDNPIYDDIAKQHNVPLFADEWSRILSDKSLKSDEIHGNAQGYQQFAENIQDYLKKQGFI